MTYKSFVYGVFAVAAALLPVAQAASAGEGLTGWVERVNRQIEQRLQDPAGTENGSAKIAFRRGADGRATDVVLIGGSKLIGAEAMRTAKALRNLPPLPAGFPADQRVMMNVMVMGPDHQDEYIKSRAQMLASAQTTNTKLSAHMASPQLTSLEQR